MYQPVEGMLEGIGQVSLNLGQALRYIWERRINGVHVVQQIAAIGYDSVPIAMIISLISGCVLALHAAEKFAMTGANAYVGALVALATVREMGPIFTAMAVGARSGTAISAEIANMAVTDQLDALKIMHVNPIRYLMVPRVIACVISLPLITVLSEAVGILGGMVTSRYTALIHFSQYMDSVWLTLKWHDIEVSLIKAAIFGVILAGIAVTTGLNTRGGARSVGLATTHATVWTAITIIIADFFLTWIFFGTSFADS
jgi:phospholipid/cholesterol/gamma-HCH transport system permease protein